MKSLLIALITLPYLSIAQEVAMNSIVQTSVVQTATPPTRKVEEEVAELETRHVSLTSILVKGTVRINSATKGKGLALNAALFTTGEQTRIRIDYGGASIIDYVLDGNNVIISLPYKDVAFSGTKEEVIKLKSWFSLLTSELSGLSVAFPTAWDEHASQRRFMKEKNSMIVFNVEDDVVKVLKKVVFAKLNKDLVISNVYKYDANGDLAGVITFDNYKAVEGRLLPHKIAFAVNEETTIQFEFGEVQFDQAANSNVFKLTIPTETRKFDVGELEKKDWLSN
jgi:hypothetical protein